MNDLVRVEVVRYVVIDVVCTQFVKSPAPICNNNICDDDEIVYGNKQR